MDWQALYINSIQKRFEELKYIGDHTFNQINEHHLHVRLEGSNSIAMIVQHLHGSMISRFSHLLTMDGEKATRDREREFVEREHSFGAIAAMWEQGWLTVFQALKQLTAQHLVHTVTIRGEEHVLFDAINRQLAHYSYHIGQMVYVAKMLRGAQWQPIRAQQVDAAQLTQYIVPTERLFDV